MVYAFCMRAVPHAFCMWIPVKKRDMVALYPFSHSDLGKIWMEAVSQEVREGLNTELDLEKPAQPTYVTFFATYVTFGNLCHFFAEV